MPNIYIHGERVFECDAGNEDNLNSIIADSQNGLLGIYFTTIVEDREFAIQTEKNDLIQGSIDISHDENFKLTCKFSGVIKVSVKKGVLDALLDNPSGLLIDGIIDSNGSLATVPSDVFPPVGIEAKLQISKKAPK